MTSADAPPQRYGITIPFDDIPLADQQRRLQLISELGYTDVWSAEAMGTDAFTPLALASVWAPLLRLGTAIVPAYTRGPALLAQTVASLACAAPGRVALGLGTSSNVIVQDWNGIPFERPFHQVRDTVRFLREVFAGERFTGSVGRYEVTRFKLGVRPPEPVPILVAALRPGMLALAGREADGVILNWLGADDVPRVAGVVHEAAGGAAREVVARLFVVPSEDRQRVLSVGRFAIAAYMNVPVYAEFHRWLGRGEAFAGMWEAWDSGDRAGALAAIPEEIVDQLIISGSPEECRAHIDRYVAHGVTTPVLALLPAGGDVDTEIAQLAPR